jgi:hypothetical protein
MPNDQAAQEPLTKAGDSEAEKAAKREKFFRETLALFLERLRKIEADRGADLLGLTAAILTLRKLSPAVDALFKTEMQALEQKKASDPKLDLSDIYDEAIRLLRSPDLSEQDRQERLRQILESFQGRPQ